MNFAKELLPNESNVIPFQREGTLPTVRQFQDRYTYEDALKQEVVAWEGRGKLAILTKTMDEAQQLLHDLPDGVQLIQEHTDSFRENVLIAPAYLAKGIEFDRVIIAEVTDENYHTARDRHMLYTSATRAMHQLEVFVIGELPNFIEHVPSDRFQLIAD
ncbi:DNA helicase [Geomicrobium sp. JCM 19037]|nr:DNA helicase [Geomicrobium sp. JCM 19037]